MIRIKTENNMTFIGTADEGHGKAKNYVLIKRILETLADFLLGYAEQIITAPFKDEIKFEIVKRIRKQLEDYPGWDTHFAAILMIPDRNILWHVSFGKASIYGTDQNNNHRHISWNIEFQQKSSNICEEGCTRKVRVGIEKLDKYKTIYLFSTPDDLYILMCRNKGEGGRDCEEYEQNMNTSETGKTSWIKKNQCIVTIHQRCDIDTPKC